MMPMPSNGMMMANGMPMQPMPSQQALDGHVFVPAPAGAGGAQEGAVQGVLVEGSAAGPPSVVQGVAAAAGSSANGADRHETVGIAAAGIQLFGEALDADRLESAQ